MVGQQVLNRRVLPGGVVPADAVYVGRPSGWGNPFAIGRDGSREEVIARYRVWLWQQLGRDPEFLAPLRGRRLVCWCAPEPCHADVLVRALAWRYGE